MDDLHNQTFQDNANEAIQSTLNIGKLLSDLECSQIEYQKRKMIHNFWNLRGGSDDPSAN